MARALETLWCKTLAVSLRLKQLSLLIGAALIIVGLALLIPTIAAMMHSRIVLGRVVDVIPGPSTQTTSACIWYLNTRLKAPSKTLSYRIRLGRYRQDDDNTPFAGKIGIPSPPPIDRRSLHPLPGDF